MTSALQNHPVVSRETWLAARRELLAKERALTDQRDELSRERRALPWVKVDKNYVFETPKGPQSLAALFGQRSQLIVYHFMFGPGWEHGCPSCSFLMDHVEGALPHLQARDVSLVVVSRAPLAEFAAFKKRMGWRFNWVSSAGSDFNFDYHVSFTKEQLAAGKVDYNYEPTPTNSEEMPGVSVFYKNAAGDVFHTYSSFARGLDLLVGTYNYLDLTPKGRDEDGLAFTMAWVRFHDQYGLDYSVDPEAEYAPPQGSTCSHCEPEHQS